MTLTDTGPLVALINRKDPNFGRCAAATKRLPAGPLVTTWPCFTEAMYLLLRAGGYPAQAALWQLRRASRLVLHEPTVSGADRMAELMDQYQDKPMDPADASVIAAAEQLGTKLVFTLDSDFLVYRLDDGSALTLVP